MILNLSQSWKNEKENIISDVFVKGVIRVVKMASKGEENSFVIIKLYYSIAYGIIYLIEGKNK